MVWSLSQSWWFGLCPWVGNLVFGSSFFVLSPLGVTSGVGSGVVSDRFRLDSLLVPWFKIESFQFEFELELELKLELELDLECDFELELDLARKLDFGLELELDLELDLERKLELELELEPFPKVVV